MAAAKRAPVLAGLLILGLRRPFRTTSPEVTFVRLFEAFTIDSQVVAEKTMIISSIASKLATVLKNV